MEAVGETKKCRHDKELRQIFRRAVGGEVRGPRGEAAVVGTSGACRSDLSTDRCLSV